MYLLNSIFIVPFTQNNDFISQDNKIKQLLVLCDTNSDRIALFGMGGASKTQVALKLAYKICKKQPKRSIL